MNTIAQLAKDCPREDCSIRYHGSSCTLMGWMPTYDKRGNPQGRDPNWTTSSYSCAKCGVEWKVKSRSGDPDEVTKFEPQAKVAAP